MPNFPKTASVSGRFLNFSPSPSTEDKAVRTSPPTRETALENTSMFDAEAPDFSVLPDKVRSLAEAKAVMFRIASPVAFKLFSSVSTRRVEPDTAPSNRFLPASSIWYLSETRKTLRDSFAILFHPHLVSQRFVVGLHIQDVVHQGYIGQIQRSVLQALVTAQTVKNRTKQPFFSVRKRCPFFTARHLAGSARKVTSFCIKFARFLRITKKPSKTVSKASRSSNIRLPSDTTGDHSIPCLR